MIMEPEIMIALATSLLFSLLVYAFSYRTIRPAQDPSKGAVPVVPSLIPWLGNFLEFQRDPVHFMQQCRQKFGSVYKILLAGQKIIVLADSKAIAHMNRDIDNALTNRPVHIHNLKVVSGITANREHVCDVMHSKLIPPLMKTLSPGSMTTILNVVEPTLRAELGAMRSQYKWDRPVLLSLGSLISRPLYRAGCLSLFGPTFPLDSLDDFQLLDIKYPQLNLGLPFIASDAVLARSRIVSIFEAYIKPIWAGEAVEGVSDVIATSLLEMQPSVTLHEAACLLTCFTFGFHSNTWYMVFWLISNLLVHEESYELLVKEILEAGDTAASTPLLDSAVAEVFRWATAATTIRMATKDTSLLVDGKHFVVAKGECVLADVQSLHYDEAVYTDPGDFCMDRFVDDESGRKVPKPAPFGGGAHICPGRHLATFEIKRFMSIFLRLYEVKGVLKDSEGKPRLPHVNRRDFVGTVRASEECYLELKLRD